GDLPEAPRTAVEPEMATDQPKASLIAPSEAASSAWRPGPIDGVGDPTVARTAAWSPTGAWARDIWGAGRARCDAVPADAMPGCTISIAVGIPSTAPIAPA